MSYSPTDFGPRKSYIGTWIATLLLIVGFIVSLVWFPPLYEKPAAEASSSVLFVGRFHPILLHLPVGALILLSIMELGCMTRNGEAKLGPAALLTLFVGAAGSVLAVLAGIMLSREGGYEGGNFTLHQTLALVGTTGILIALVIRIIAMGKGSFEMLHGYRALFFISFGIMGLGAHFGGNMSHGSKFLTEHAPEPMKSQMVSMEKWMLSFVEKPKAAAPASAPAAVPAPAPAPLPNPDPKQPGTTPVPAADAGMTANSSSPAPAGTPTPIIGGTVAPTLATGSDKLVFQHVILPILEAKCNKCHNEEKSRGDLRLDTHELALQGGENGASFVAGKPGESLSIQRIDLPVDDDEHMPPDGKAQLTPEETALLKWWVQEGASNTLKVAEAKFPAETQTTVDALLKVQP